MNSRQFPDPRDRDGPRFFNSDTYRPAARDDESRRDRRRDGLPPLHRTASSNSVASSSRRSSVAEAPRSPVESPSPVAGPMTGSPLAMSPSRPSSNVPSGGRAQGAGADAPLSREARTLIDLISKRAMLYHGKVEAQRKLDQVKARAERLASAPQEFGSQARLLKTLQKEAAQQMAKDMSASEDLDRKIYSAFVALKDKMASEQPPPPPQQPDLSAIETRLQAFEASLEKKMEERLSQHKKKLDEDRQTEEVEITRRLDAQDARHAELTRRLDSQTSRLETMEAEHVRKIDALKEEHASKLRTLEEAQEAQAAKVEELKQEDANKMAVDSNPTAPSTGHMDPEALHAMELRVIKAVAQSNVSKLAEFTSRLEAQARSIRAIEEAHAATTKAFEGKHAEFAQRLAGDKSQLQSIRDSSQNMQAELTGRLEDQAFLLQRYNAEQSTSIRALREQTSEMQLAVQQLSALNKSTQGHATSGFQIKGLAKAGRNAPPGASPPPPVLQSPTQASPEPFGTPVKSTEQKELEVEMSFLRKMFKETIGDVRRVEMTVSDQGVTVQSASTDIKDAKQAIARLQDLYGELQAKVQQQDGATASSMALDRPNKAPSPGAAAITGGSIADEAHIANMIKVQAAAVVDVRFKESEAKSRDKWDRIMKGFGDVMRDETAERQRVEALVGELRARVDELGETVGARIQSMGETYLATTLAAILPAHLAPALAPLQSRLSSVYPVVEALDRRLAQTISLNKRIESDLNSRIAHLANWRDNFNSAEMVDRMVRHVTASIPGGVQSQIHRLADRVSWLERNAVAAAAAAGEADGGPNAAKRRKVSNHVASAGTTGSASPSVAPASVAAAAMASASGSRSRSPASVVHVQSPAPQAVSLQEREPALRPKRDG